MWPMMYEVVDSTNTSHQEGGAQHGNKMDNVGEMKGGTGQDTFTGSVPSPGLVPIPS
jgi:hypothetical protein